MQHTPPTHRPRVPIRLVAAETDVLIQVGACHEPLLLFGRERRRLVQRRGLTWPIDLPRDALRQRSGLAAGGAEPRQFGGFCCERDGSGRNRCAVRSRVSRMGV